MKCFWILALCLSSFSVAGAKSGLLPKNPRELCERFLGDGDKKNCRQKLRKVGPDWYLAEICSLQYEDGEFWKCLELTKAANFSPSELDSCKPETLSDAERLACVKSKALSAGRSPYQDMNLKAPGKAKKKKDLKL